MKDKKIVFAVLMAATAVTSLIIYLKRKNRRFNHHPEVYTPARGVSEWEFSI